MVRRFDPDRLRIARGNYNFTDDGGVQGTFTIFTITEDVLLQVFGICDVALTSAGTPTLELGVSGGIDDFITQIVDATTLVANEVWIDETPTLTKEVLDPAAIPRTWIVANGQDVIMTLGGADLTAGDIDFYALWRPLTSIATVVAT